MKKTITRVFDVRKRSLLAIAGVVWCAAGVNVAHLGMLSYAQLPIISPLSIALSVVVFAMFGAMFLRITVRHTTRIHGYSASTLPFWHFFDVPSYLIMGIMMGGGIWLRFSGLVPTQCIAVFYTGLGCALALAGVVLLWQYCAYAQYAQHQ